MAWSERTDALNTKFDFQLYLLSHLSPARRILDPCIYTLFEYGNCLLNGIGLPIATFEPIFGKRGGQSEVTFSPRWYVVRLPPAAE